MLLAEAGIDNTLLAEAGIDNTLLAEAGIDQYHYRLKPVSIIKYVRYIDTIESSEVSIGCLDGDGKCNGVCNGNGKCDGECNGSGKCNGDCNGDVECSGECNGNGKCSGECNGNGGSRCNGECNGNSNLYPLGCSVPFIPVPGWDPPTLISFFFLA